MKELLTPLIQFQRFFIPAMLLLLVWASYRLAVKKDFAVGLALYLSLVVIVDAYMNTALYLPGLEKGSIHYSEICALVLLAMRPKAAPRPPPYDAVLWLVRIYFLLMFLSVFRSADFMPALMEYRTVMVPQILAFTIASRGLHSPEDLRRFLLWFTALVMVICLFCFWDAIFDRWILKSEMLDKPIYYHTRKMKRFGSILLNPNYLGAFVTLVFPVLLAWSLGEREKRQRFLAWGCLLLLAFSLVETQSRGAMLGFAVGLVLLVLGPAGSISRARRAGILFGALAVFLILMPGFATKALERFNQMETETMEGRSRETTWQYAVQMIWDHPIGGIGFGEKQFYNTMVDMGFEQKYGVKALDAPHNSYLEIGVYTGVPGLLVFLAANLVLLWRAARVALRPENPLGPMVFGFAVGIMAFLASVFPDLQLFTVNVAPVYWAFMMLLLWLVTQPATAAEAAAGQGWRGAAGNGWRAAKGAAGEHGEADAPVPAPKPPGTRRWGRR